MAGRPRGGNFRCPSLDVLLQAESKLGLGHPESVATGIATCTGTELPFWELPAWSVGSMWSDRVSTRARKTAYPGPSPLR